MPLCSTTFLIRPGKGPELGVCDPDFELVHDSLHLNRALSLFVAAQFFQRGRGALRSRGQLETEVIEDPEYFPDADIRNGPVFDLAQCGASDSDRTGQLGLRQFLSPSRFPDSVAKEKKHLFLTPLFHILNVYTNYGYNVLYKKQSQVK